MVTTWLLNDPLPKTAGGLRIPGPFAHGQQQLLAVSQPQMSPTLGCQGPGFPTISTKVTGWAQKEGMIHLLHLRGALSCPGI